MAAQAQRQVLITADDFGWTDSQNQAVLAGVLSGTLHRASLLCNGAGFAQAVVIAHRHPQLGVGVHLTLCEGDPISQEASRSRLCSPAGHFPDGLLPLLGLFATGALPLATVEAEWRAQIERALDAGISPSHLDGHKHVHLLPPLFDLTVRLAQRYRIPFVRVPREAPSLRAVRRVAAWTVLSTLSHRALRRLSGTGLRTADHFVGFSESGGMSPARLVAAIQSARPGVTEIMVHPAQEGAGLAMLRARYDWARRYRFSDELDALRHPATRAALGDLR